MKSPLTKLTATYLESLPQTRLHGLTQQAIGNLAVAKLLLGRCLLAVKRSGLYAEWGCSSYIHYAIILGVNEKVARTAQLVARRLEDLPLLTAAAEQGTVNWTNLRLVIARATPDTEARWLQVAQQYSSRIVERLVRRAREGQDPGDPDSDRPTTESEEVVLKLWLEKARMALLERVVVEMSHREGRAMSLNETLEYLAADFLAGATDEQTRARLRDEVRKDEQAAEEREAEAEISAWDAVGAIDVECPGEQSVRLVERANWQNPRLGFNEEARHTTPAQRQELLRRDGYRCSTPGCTHTIWLQVHHIAFYCEHGKTVPENLLVVCSGCHRHIHDGVLLVRGRAPDGLVWTDAMGRNLERGVSIESNPEFQNWMARAGQDEVLSEATNAHGTWRD
jgi:5-methylcytosine-specific restriction endonuclease McrA